MIVALIGTPSPLTYITTHILRAVVQVVWGEHHAIGANTVADLRAGWPKKEDRLPAVVLASDMPQPELVRFLVQAKTPFLVCVEPPSAVADYMIGARGFDPISALRVGTQALSYFEPIAIALPPTALHFANSSRPLGRVLRDLLHFCQIDTGPGTAEQIAAFLGCSGEEDIPLSEFLAKTGATMFPALGKREPFDQQVLDAISAVSEGYENVANGRPVSDMLWPGACFLQANTAGVMAEGELDLEGRARFLVHGPYFHLPPGHWEAEIAVEVAESFSENILQFDVSAGRVLAACKTKLPEYGSFAIDLAFQITDVTQPVEFRIQLLSGAIEGRIKLLGVRLKRQKTSEYAGN